MGELWGQYVKWNKPLTKRQTLYDCCHMRHLVESNHRESRMLVAEGRGRGEWGVRV